MAMLAAIKKFPLFVREVRSELKKVSWSTRKELIAATGVVLAGSLFLTVYIALVDIGLSKIMQVLIK